MLKIDCGIVAYNFMITNRTSGSSLDKKNPVKFTKITFVNYFMIY